MLLLFCFSFPLLFCGHTFSRLTRGGLTNPAVVSPAPRPSEGQGVRLCAGAMDAPFRGILSAYFVACGARYPRTPGVQGLLSGMGAFCAPTQALFHTHLLFFPAPFFFLSAFEARLAMDSMTRCADGTLNSNYEFRDAALRTPRKTLRLPICLFGADFFYGLGGNAVRFFCELFSGDRPPSFCVFSEFCLS